MAYTTPYTSSAAAAATRVDRRYPQTNSNAYTLPKLSEGTTYVKAKPTSTYTEWQKMNVNPSMLDPWNEARRSADMKYAQYSRGVNDAIANLRSEQDRAVQRTTGYARQEMADQGLLSSTNAIDKVNQYGEQASAPYLQQIAQQRANLQNYGNQLGEDATLMFQQLARSQRDEAFRNRQFDEMVRQFGVNAALQWWDAMSAKELGLEQLNPDYKPNWPSVPSGMINSIYSTPGKGYGPIGDATDKFTTKKRTDLGTSGARLSLTENARQFDAEQSRLKDNADRQLTLSALASGYKYDPATGAFSKDALGGLSDQEFREMLLNAATSQLTDPTTGQPMGYQNDTGKLQSLAKTYGRNLWDYRDMLTGARPDVINSLDALRQTILANEGGAPNAALVAKGVAGNPNNGSNFGSWVNAEKQHLAGNYNPYAGQGLLKGVGEDVVMGFAGLLSRLQDMWTALTHGRETPKYNW